jgi:hypothetical protein
VTTIYYGLVVAVYVTVSVYVPAGSVVSALTAYHTVVVSAVAVAAVLLSVIGEPVAGTPAHFDVLDALFVSVLYDASKPFVPIPVVPVLTATPQVLFVSAIGDAFVPELAAKLLPPFASVVVASLSARVRLYPVELLVLTLIESLPLLSTPAPVGVSAMDTVVLVEILMTAETAALIVVLADCATAPTIAGDNIVRATEKTATAAPIRCCVPFIISSLSLFSGMYLLQWSQNTSVMSSKSGEITN